MNRSARPPCLTLENIWRTYGRRRALSRIGLDLGQGETLAIFGANGAGKSTLINVASTLLAPSRGRILYNGKPLDSSVRFTYRRSFGLVSHATFLYDDLTCRENLILHARLRDLSSPAAVVDELLHRMSLWPVQQTAAAHLSRGMQQRLALARALLGSPPLLLLDEPTTGLDPRGVSLVREIIGQRSSHGLATMFSTHDLELGLFLAHRYLLLQDGELRALGACQPLRDADSRRLNLEDLASQPA
ncbi:MAG: ATP-binding cassette domain-containing protein [Acidobacteriota bacterium]